MTIHAPPARPSASHPTCARDTRARPARIKRLPAAPYEPEAKPEHLSRRSKIGRPSLFHFPPVIKPLFRGCRTKPSRTRFLVIVSQPGLGVEESFSAYGESRDATGRSPFARRRVSCA